MSRAKYFFLALLISLKLVCCSLPNATIQVKTNHFENYPHRLKEFKENLDMPLQDGYCKTKLNNLYRVSNRIWCQT